MTMRKLIRFRWPLSERGRGKRKDSCYIEPIEVASTLSAKHCGDQTADCSNGVLVYDVPCKVVKPFGTKGGLGALSIVPNAENIASTIAARDSKGISRHLGDAVMEIKIVGNKNPSGHGQGGVVYDQDGICGALNVAKATAPNVAVRAVLTPEREEKRQNGRRMKDEGEPMFTLTSQDRHGVVISELPLAYDEQNSTLRKDGTVGTLTTDGSSPKHNNRIIVDAEHVRIRRLTPRECWRLQGFPDEYFDKAAAVISDTQLYRTAGNAVTVNVARAIGEKLKEIENEETQI